MSQRVYNITLPVEEVNKHNSDFYGFIYFMFDDSFILDTW